MKTIKIVLVAGVALFLTLAVVGNLTMLPLGHSEELKHLEMAVKLTGELAQQAPPPFRKFFEHSASQARAHRDVIARFGRQPHRNVILGRHSTAEEIEYLAAGEFVHQRSLPP